MLAFYTVYFGRADGDYRQSFVFVCLLLPLTAATTYFFTRFLIPRYLLARRYGRFALYSAYALVGSVYLALALLMAAFVFIAEYRIGAMTPATLDVPGLLVGTYLVVFLAAAIDLLDRWYAMQAANTRLAQARLEAELKLKEAELHLLKAQIHPHFLFNTLNNLYGLALARSDQTPEAVLRLAELLDYMLYRTQAPRVPLADEVAHLRTYVALEKLRYDDRVTVAFEADGPFHDAAIAPMLLLPFVENAFKHGVRPNPGAAWVDLRAALAGSTLTFTAANGTPPAAAYGGEGEGLGLATVRRRLDLLYPGAHTLTVDDAPGRYTVTLHLTLDAHADDVPAGG